MFGHERIAKLIADVKMIEAELQTNGIFQKIASDVVSCRLRLNGRALL